MLFFSLHDPAAFVIRKVYILLISEISTIYRQETLHTEACEHASDIAVNLSLYYAMKAFGGVDIYIHIFLVSALVGSEWSASRPGRFTHWERASVTHWIGGWMDPRVGLDDMEKRKFLTLLGLKLRTLGRPARSQSLYRLRNPGSSDVAVLSFNNCLFHMEFVTNKCEIRCIFRDLTTDWICS
jgi:hypothetical protein